MKALVKTKLGPDCMRYMEMQEPRPAEDEIKVRVYACGICGTDIHLMHDEYPSKPPIITGHEFSGVVVETGKNVTDFQVGDRVVTLTAIETCEECEYCRQGLRMLCPERKSVGSGINGGFAEFVILPARHAFHIPEGVSLRTAALCEPLACVVRGVCERTSITAGDYVLVAGAGVMAQLTAQVVMANGGNVIMTSDQHKSGTDRCYEAYCKIGDGYDVVVNIQGDEPFIQPEQIEILKACFIDDSIQIATLVKPFRPDDDFETTLFNANSPKVVLNKKNEAMYFSRSIIPYMRGRKYTEWLPNHTYYKHIGLYAYRADTLKEITHLPQSPLELAESLEQLRWLENGYKIKVGITQQETIGIDTPEDMEKALAFLKNREYQPTNESASA